MNVKKMLGFFLAPAQLNIVVKEVGKEIQEIYFLEDWPLNGMLFHILLMHRELFKDVTHTNFSENNSESLKRECLVWRFPETDFSSFRIL